MTKLLELLLEAAKIPGFIASLTEGIRLALVGDGQGAERAFRRATLAASAKKAYRA